ncbi:hypothetical protein [Paenibacillus sp.]|uniref:hypothetical protein n=1 Tax=Paenibacillus sp. TaxID=58172 RepID=UPI002D4BBE35|nr:hypothetical protein [Paenibacillus sp.]HZG83343.1 hypothetical protein [Paenibacillus sp.]
MQGRLLIKHAVGGRTFVDSAKGGTPFEAKELPDGAGWAFEVRLAAGEAADEIVKWRNELNVFVFEEDRQPVVKHWFYADGGSVAYDEPAGVLRLRAASKIEYVPDEYTW